MMVNKTPVIISFLIVLMMINTTLAESYAVPPQVACEKADNIITQLRLGYEKIEWQIGDEGRLITMFLVIETYMEDARDDPVDELDDKIAVLAMSCKEYLDWLDSEGKILTATDHRIEFFYNTAVDYRNRKVSPVNTIYVGTDTKEEIRASQMKDFNVMYDMDTNIVHLSCGKKDKEATLKDVFYKLQDSGVTLLYRESPDVWVMKTTIVIEPDMTFRIENPKPTTYLWLKLANCGNSPSRIIVNGNLHMDSIRISSWDPVTETFLMDATAPRAEIKFNGGSGIIQHCRLEQLGYASSTRQTHGITVIESDNVKIYDNTIIGGFQGINIQHSHDITARGNVIEDPFDTGILLEDRSYKCNILSNIVSGSGRHGIMIFDKCRDSSILTNTLHDNFGHGIKVFKGCYNLDISENIAKDNFRKGIAVFASKDLQINRNIVINGTGIVVSHKSKNCTISDNRFENVTIAIGLIGVDNDVITVGEAINVAYEEFEIYSEYNIVLGMYGDVTGCTVSNNDIRICTIDGIKLVNTHYNTIHKNTILLSEKYGIMLIGSWFNELSDNEIANVGKAKYCATENSFDNTLIKNDNTYILTDRGCTIISVDINKDGCINLNELDDLGLYIIGRVRWWFS